MWRGIITSEKRDMNHGNAEIDLNRRDAESTERAQRRQKEIFY